MKKILISILAVVGALVIAFVACYFSIPNFNGWVNGKISSGITGGTDDSGSDDKNDTENKDGDVDENGGTEIEIGESNGVALYSAKLPRSAYEANDISPLADTAFMLTATIEPANADNKEVDYSIAWKNPASLWASGKDIADYLTIVQATDGALTATLTCKQAFAEQAEVTVVSRSNVQATATATVDYRKKLTVSTYSIANELTLDGSTSSIKTWTWAQYDGNSTDSWFKRGSFVDTFSIGTIEDTVTSHTIEVITSIDLRSKLRSRFSGEEYSSRYTSTLVLECDSIGDGLSALDNFTWFNQGMLFGGRNFSVGVVHGLLDFVVEANGLSTLAVKASSFEKLTACMKAVETDFVVTIKTDLTYGGTVVTTYNVNVADSSLVVLARSVSLSDTSFVF